MSFEREILFKVTKNTNAKSSSLIVENGLIHHTFVNDVTGNSQG